MDASTSWSPRHGRKYFLRLNCTCTCWYIFANVTYPDFLNLNMDNVNKRIKMLIKRTKAANHRSFFLIIGSHGYKQLPVFYNLLTKGKAKDLPVLWCSRENSAAFIAENEAMIRQMNRDCDITEMGGAIFPKPHYCSYSDIQKILYQSFSLAVIQDFDALTFHVLPSIAETVRGGGMLIFLLHSVETLEDVASLKMNPEQNESRFCKRFYQSLSSSSNCLVLDDNLKILSSNGKVLGLPDNTLNCSPKEEIQALKEQHESDSIISALVGLCQTADQAKVLLKFLDVLKRRAFHATVAVSSPKGRGKSAALGLAVAGSIALNYSNIFISSLDYDNVKIIFRFLFKGLDALSYQENADYDLIESMNPELENALLGINVFRDHPQAVRFIYPGDVEYKIEQAELVIVDEAAAIPLPLLKRLVGPYVVLMASTVSGSGASGYSLHESMIDSLSQSTLTGSEVISKSPAISLLATGFEKISITEPINYAQGDGTEKWMNRLFCLEPVIEKKLSHGCPEPQQCRLFYVCREVLFSGRDYAENFLQALMSIFFSFKKISPDYLLKLADSPDYHIFCLLSPFSNAKNTSSEILSAILVHREPDVPAHIIHCGTNQEGSVPLCFKDWKNKSMPNMSASHPIQGIHVLDIVTHPDYRRMGYGLRALQLLQEFYEDKWISLDENPINRLKLDEVSSEENIRRLSEPSHPLLLQLTEVQPEKVHFFLVSYNLTSNLLRFWKKTGFVPVFITKEMSFAGEHTCFMIKSLSEEFQHRLDEYWRCFREYYYENLSSTCQKFSASFALNLLRSKAGSQRHKELTKAEIDVYLKPRRMKALDKYCQNLGDLHCIVPCIPIISKLYFRNCFKGITLPVVQEAILLSIGLQRKSMDEISKDLGLPAIQLHGLLNRTIRKLTKYLTEIIEQTVEQAMVTPKVTMLPVQQDLDQELEEAAEKVRQQQAEDSKKLFDMDFSQYAIKGSEDDWQTALHSGRKTLVSIKSLKKKPEDAAIPDQKISRKFQKGKHKHIKKKR